MSTKRCAGKCGLEKDLEDFYKCRAAPDGRQAKCKVCDNELRMKRMLGKVKAVRPTYKCTFCGRAGCNAGRHRRRGASFSQEEANKVKTTRWARGELGQAYAKGRAYGPKEKARRAVAAEVAAGRLRKGSCAQRARGGCAGRIEAHHHAGYDEENWFVVTWLCRAHHDDSHHRSRRTRQPASKAACT